MTIRKVDAFLRSPVLGGLLWLAAVSATMIESDTYRYACGILALIALRFYLLMPERPKVSWIGWLCMGWAAFALLLFLVMFAFVPGHPIGESEFLYCFPFFFPILGVAFQLYWGAMERIVAAFFVLALAMLAFTTRFHEILLGETVRPLIQNNQIHGAVCCGILLIGACFWLLHYATTPGADRRIARLSQVVAPLVMTLSLIAIYGAKSKGVWLAFGITLPVLAVLTLRYLDIRKGAYAVAGAAALLLVGTYAVRANLDHFAGPTVSATISMLEGSGDGHGISGAVTNAISSSSTPLSMDERLKLWSNAWELISASPIFGWGNEWLDHWYHARYPAQYNLMHDGYLEILIRYGLFGAAIFLTMIVAFWRVISRASRAGIVPASAFHAYTVILFFFALTLLSNSNNRLAIGESLALVSSAFACACQLRLDEKDKQPGAART